MIKRISLPSVLEFAVLGYCIFQASDLVTSWVTTPAARWAWIAFIIWCLPAVLYVTTTIRYGRVKESSPILLGLAITISLISGLGSLNILGHIGLALAIAGLMPFHLAMIPWLATALSWLPSFGWMIKSLPFAVMPAIQITLATVGTAILIFSTRRP